MPPPAIEVYERLETLIDAQKDSKQDREDAYALVSRSAPAPTPRTYFARAAVAGRLAENRGAAGDGPRHRNRGLRPSGPRRRPRLRRGRRDPHARHPLRAGPAEPGQARRLGDRPRAARGRGQGSPRSPRRPAAPRRGVHRPQRPGARQAEHLCIVKQHEAELSAGDRRCSPSCSPTPARRAAPHGARPPRKPVRCATPTAQRPRRRASASERRGTRPKAQRPSRAPASALCSLVLLAFSLVQPPAPAPQRPRPARRGRRARGPCPLAPAAQGGARLGRLAGRARPRRRGPRRAAPRLPHGAPSSPRWSRSPTSSCARACVASPRPTTRARPASRSTSCAAATTCAPSSATARTRFLAAGEALAADLDMRRIAVICPRPQGSDAAAIQASDRALHLQIVAAAKASGAGPAHPRRLQGWDACKAPPATPSSEPSPLDLGVARSAGPGPLRAAARRLRVQLSAGDVAALLGAELQGELGLDIVTHDELRAWIGETSPVSIHDAVGTLLPRAADLRAPAPRPARPRLRAARRRRGALHRQQRRQAARALRRRPRGRRDELAGLRAGRRPAQRRARADRRPRGQRRGPPAGAAAASRTRRQELSPRAPKPPVPKDRSAKPAPPRAPAPRGRAGLPAEPDPRPGPLAVVRASPRRRRQPAQVAAARAPAGARRPRRSGPRDRPLRARRGARPGAARTPRSSPTTEARRYLANGQPWAALAVAERGPRRDHLASSAGPSEPRSCSARPPAASRADGAESPRDRVAVRQVLGEPWLLAEEKPAPATSRSPATAAPRRPQRLSRARRAARARRPRPAPRGPHAGPREHRSANAPDRRDRSQRRLRCPTPDRSPARPRPHAPARPCAAPSRRTRRWPAPAASPTPLFYAGDHRVAAAALADELVHARRRSPRPARCCSRSSPSASVAAIRPT
jgi:hypothetical protein